MQRSVMKRPGSEQSRIPHILYIDEFPDFLCNPTLSLFTLYRKYGVGTVVTAQNLEQLNATPTSRRTILSNCTTKIVFGNLSPEENEFWSNEFGDRREWLYTRDMTMKGEKPGNQFLMGESSVSDVSYGDFKGIKWGWKKNFELGKLQALKFKNCAFKYKDDKGKSFTGVAILDFMPSKYKEPHKVKNFDFSKFQGGMIGDNVKEPKEHKGFKPKEIDFDAFSDDQDVNPIQTDVTDSSYLFNNEDAIIYDIKKKSDKE